MLGTEISQKIAKNSFYNFVGKIWNSLIAIILTPYIIGKIGTYRYGIWALVGVITGYTGFLDFGVSVSFVKYISEYHTKKEYEELNAVVNTGFLFYLVLAIITISASYFCKGFIANFFKIPKDMKNEAVFVFLVGISIFCLSNAFNIFKAILDGLQRMDLNNKVDILLSFPRVIGVVFFFGEGVWVKGFDY
ncbi:MAG: oligosaccharide flippase family protein [bacterium]